MDTCYLHIGTEKTGTSTIQQFLCSNEDELRKQGIWYSRSLDRPSNRKFAVYAQDFNKDAEGFRRYRIGSPEEHTTFKADVEHHFREEVAAFRAANGRAFVISSEHLHSRLPREELVMRVKGLLAPLFESVRIICFLRPQIEVVISLASTAIRVGKVVDKSFFEIGPADAYYNYDRLLTRWTNVFGRAQMKVTAYHKHLDVLKFFISELSITVGEDFKMARRTNKAIDVAGMAIANLYVLRFGHGSQVLRKVLENTPTKHKVGLARSLAVEIQTRFDASNKKVLDEFPEIQQNDLTPDWNQFEEAGNLHLLEVPAHLHEPIIRIIVEMETLAEALSKNPHRNGSAASGAAQAERESKLEHLAKELSYYKTAYESTPGVARIDWVRKVLFSLDRFVSHDRFVPDNYLLDPYVFDSEFYLKANNLHKIQIHDLANHWLTLGVKQGLPSSRLFQVKYYLKKNPDLKRFYKKNYKAAIGHWIDHGRKEGRIASSFTEL